MSSPNSAPQSRRAKKSQTRSAPSAVSEDTLAELTATLKLLADASRLKILFALAKNGEMHVKSLCALLDQSQPAVSHHLIRMADRRLLSCRREGKHNYYRLECSALCALLEQAFAEHGNSDQQIHLGEFGLSYQRLR